MKLLYILSDYPTFSETFIGAEIDQWKKKGYQVEVISLRPRLWFKKQEGVIYNSINPFILFFAIVQSLIKGSSIFQDRGQRKELKGLSIKRPDKLLTWIYINISLDYLSTKIKPLNPDYILTHFLFTGSLVGSSLAQKFNVPYHLRIHTNSTNLPFGEARNVIDRASSVSAISNDALKFLEDQFDFNDAILARQSLLPKLWYERSISAGDQNQIRLICAGRFAKEKGYDQLILALAKLDSQTLNHIRLHIYGEGQMKVHYEELIAKYELNDSISILPRTDHHTLMNHIANADLLVVPSMPYNNHMDGIPTVIPEAMMIGTLVVATILGGIPELISHGRTGFLSENNQPENLKQCILAALEKRSEWSEIINEARTKVIEEYDINLSDLSSEIFNKN